jgi:stage II sporulation protein D
LLVLLVTAVPAEAVPRRAANPVSARKATAARKPVAARKPPPPKPGWLVDKARFEPLVPSTDVLGVAGVGDYRGALEIVPSGSGGGVAVVNEVGLEDYVRGIAEVPSSWPMEAQKAQAIAARTYALHELSLDVATAAKDVGAQICATEACQVYAGVAKERDAGGAGVNWAAAVTQTAGQVILFQGAPINAKYSSSNGGRSVSGGRPYLRPVNDPDDAYSPLHRWRSIISLADVAAGLGLPGTIVQMGRSGDLLLIDWQGADQAVDRLTIAAPDFRSRMNAALPAPAGLPRTVPSIWFSPVIDHGAEAVMLDGGGWGHGVGMSQWGAYGKALKGMKAPDILASYYSGLRPTALPPERLPTTIRVAVDLGRPAADVLGTGRFRVFDGGGRAVAVATSGQWRVVPEGRGVRVLPPPGQDQVPAVEPLAVDPAAPPTPVTVKFRLSTPAVVRLTVADEAGAPAAEVQPGLLEAGDVTQTVPALSQPGRYVVTIAADAGGGRTASVPVAVEVPPSTLAPTTAAAARARIRARLAAANSTSGHGPNAPIPARGRASAAAAALLIVVGAAALVARRAAGQGRLH